MENNDNEDLPDLNINDDISFKRLKLSFYLEDNVELTSGTLSPEQEIQFLDQMLSMYKKFEEVKKVTVFEKIGKPAFFPVSELSDEEVKLELTNLKKLLRKNKVPLVINYKYNPRIIYNFITTEFFQKLVSEKYYDTPLNRFEYEEFYPNYEEYVKQACSFFWEDFCDRKNDYFEKNLQNIDHSEDLIKFRDLFSSFAITSLKVRCHEIIVDGDNASAAISVSFVSENQGHTIRHSGKSKMTFIYNKMSHTWTVKSAEVPVKIN